MKPDHKPRQDDTQVSGFLGLSVSNLLGGGVWVMAARLFSQVAQLVGRLTGQADKDPFISLLGTYRVIINKNCPEPGIVWQG